MPKKLKTGERRSKNEEGFEALLNEKGIKYEYEPETFEIIPRLKGTLRMTSPLKYTPDYKLLINGKVIWIEVKGFARPLDLLKFKLADWYFTKKGEYFLTAGTFSPVSSPTRGYYNYETKRHIKRINELVKKGIAKYITVDGKICYYMLRDNGILKVGQTAKIPDDFWTVLDRLVNKEEA